MTIFSKKPKSEIADKPIDPLPVPEPPKRETPDYAKEYKMGAVVIKPHANGKYGLYEKREIFGWGIHYYGLELLMVDEFTSIEKARSRYRHIKKKPIVIAEEA